MSKQANYKIIDVGNVNLRCQVTGKAHAPWVTVAHSLATDMSMWEPQLSELGEHFQVLSFDARGHGGSSCPNGPSAMTDLIDDVLLLWDRLSIDHSHFIGLSMGGMIGVGLALKTPTRVNSLIACDCRLDAPDFFKNMWDQRIKAVASGGMEEILEKTMQTWFTQKRLAQKGALIDHVEAMIVNTLPKGYLTCAEALKGLDFKRHLSDISVPTLFIVGDRDGLHPKEMAELATIAEGAELIILNDAAHLSNMEQPQQFNRAVLRFLLNQ
jgi:3-oxoadipate enol-lactonase